MLFSGLPGCDKTTMARGVAARLSFPLFAKDRMQRFVRDHLDNHDGEHGYRLIFDQAEEQLSLGISVILDAVFPSPGFRQHVAEIAAQHGAELRCIYCYCSDEAIWRGRVESRVQFVPGWPPADWAEVQRVRGYFQPWPPETILALDALAPAEENLRRALAHIQSP